VVLDLTSLVALADLQEGELIHGDNFNLFAAMSALEVFFLYLFTQTQSYNFSYRYLRMRNV